MSKVIYVKKDNFIDTLKDFKDRCMTFTLHETTYTKKIVVENDFSLIFNETGYADNRVLSLINKVRHDAKKFVDEGGKIGDDYIYYFKVIDDITNGVCCKVDVKAAYWQTALKKGVITDKTNKCFEDLYINDTYEFAKKQRLKALGALATSKRIHYYKDGKLVPNEAGERTEIITEPTKPVYIDICRSVDLLMKESAKLKGSRYYYWDCLFIDKEFSKEAVEFFQDLKYNVTIKETKLEYINIGKNGYIISVADGKGYMVRQEDKHLITKIHEKINKEKFGEEKIRGNRFI